MFDIPLAITDSDITKQVKSQANSYIDEINDYMTRKLRYNYMRLLIKFLEDVDTLSQTDKDLPQELIITYLNFLENHIHKLLTQTPICPIRFKDDKYWNEDNTHIYSPYIVREFDSGVYRYYNYNSYFIYQIEVIDLIHKERFSTLEQHKQEPLYIIDEHNVINGEYIDKCEINNTNVNEYDLMYIPIPDIVVAKKIIFERDGKEYIIYATNNGCQNVISPEYTIRYGYDKLFINESLTIPPTLKNLH